MKLTLEQRIASAFVDGKSSDLAALVTETEQAITTADQAAEAKRAAALDLVATPDADQANQSVQVAELAAQRLRNALPRLQHRLKQVEHQEYAARWRPEYEKVKKQRDTLASEFAFEYPAIVAKLVDLFHRIEQCDRECSRINGAAPAGDTRRLLGTELTARNIENFSVAPSIVATLQLPGMSNSAVMVWPVPKPSWQSEYVRQMAVPYHPGADWHKSADQRARELGETSQRALAHTVDVARERDQQEHTEANKHAREAADATRRAAGWPTSIP